MKKFVVAFAIVIIAAVALFVPKAYADDGVAIGHGSCNPCSLPYVMDVNPDVHEGVYVATIEVAGHPYTCQVLTKGGGKVIKTYRINRGVFAAKLQLGKTYIIRAKARGDKWRSIEYKIRRV